MSTSLCQSSPCALIFFLYVTFCLLVAPTPVHLQQPGFGLCPKVQVMSDFQPQKYLGKWFEIEKFISWFQTGICAEANYGPINTEGRMKVLNKELVRGRVVGISGLAYMAGENGEGRLKVELDIPVVGRQTSDYWVLGTDYSNFAVVWACRDFAGVLKFESAWILSRDRSLSSESQKEVDRILESNSITRRWFRKSVQDPEVCPNMDQQSHSPYAFPGK